MSLMRAIVKKLYLKETNKTQVFPGIKRAIYKLERFFREHEVLSWVLKIFSLAVIILVSWGVIHYYNAYAICRNYCQVYYAQVGVEFKRRQNLIPNLVLCVSEYAIHEKGIMKHVADARQVLSGPGNFKTKMEAAKQIEGTLSKLLAIVEQYPGLKAVEATQTLLKELSNTENRIVEWKNKYNDSARDFNNLLTTFPTNILGYLFRIKGPVSYIATDEDLLKVSLVNFNELPAK